MTRILPLLLAALVLINSAAHAQTAATEGKIEYQKGDKSAAVIELPYPPEVVEDAIKDLLAKKGLKGSRNKGFDIFKGTHLNDSDLDLSDLHIKVERKSRQEKNRSLVYLIVGRASENVATRSSGDSYKMEEAKHYLESMTPAVDAFNLEKEVREQEETVQKSEKKLVNLQEDQRDLEKKIRNLQEKLEDNKRDQQKQTEDVTNQKKILETTKSRRKS